MKSRAFTAKAMVCALVGLLILCVFPVYSTMVLKQSDAVKGYLPVVPLFFVVLLSFVWNSLAGKISPRLTFSSKELVVIFSLMLVVAWLPSTQHAMVRQMVLPRYEELTTNATWKEAGVTTRLPARLFPHGEGGEEIGERTHFGMIQGGMTGDQIPYGVWISPLLNWMPFMLLLVLCLLALTFIVHRQWTRHEQLRYPLASVVESLTEQDPRRPGGIIFRNRLFWFGFGIIFGLHLLRYLHAWFPNNLPNLSLEYGLSWGRLFPVIGESNASMFVLHWMPISFALIGLAFLVPTDVSLSIGLTAPLGTLVGVQYYLVTGNPVSSGDLDIFRAGGFIAFGLILAYTGRSYYFPILKKAVWPGARGAEVDPGGVWAARIFMAAYVSLVAVTATMGVGLLMAWVIVTFVLLIFLVVTRLVCETGVPIIAAGWPLPSVLSGLLGPAAVGAGPVMFMIFLNSTMVSSSSTQLIMPYMATSLKLLDDEKVNLRRFALLAKGAIILAMVVGFAAVITYSYKCGEGNLSVGERGFWTQGVRQVLSLMDFGQYETSQAATGLSKLALIRPDTSTAGLVLAGVIAVVGCYLLRFRFAKWPLHPLFFLILGTSIGKFAWTSFLLGWLIKTMMVKIGGGRAYRGSKPLFIGFIMGEFLCIALMLIVGWIYHAAQHKPPVHMFML